MLRKIRSERDPRDTVVTELKKEFAVYLDKGKVYFIGLLRKYPKQAFGLMVLLMLVSMVTSFVVFRRTGKKTTHSAMAASNKPPHGQNLTSPVTDGFGQLLEAGANLKESIALKQEVESMIAKDSLSHTDSIRLEKILDRLQQINQINHQKP